MAFRDGIDLDRLDDWITGHGGQDQFGPGDEIDDDEDDTDLHETELGGEG